MIERMENIFRKRTLIHIRRRAIVCTTAAQARGMSNLTTTSSYESTLLSIALYTESIYSHLTTIIILHILVTTTLVDGHRKSIPAFVAAF